MLDFTELGNMLTTVIHVILENLKNLISLHNSWAMGEYNPLLNRP